MALTNPNTVTLDTPSVASWGFTVAALVRWDGNGGGLITQGNFGGGGWLASSNDSGDALSLNTSGAGNSTCGSIREGVWYIHGWTVDASGVSRLFIGIKTWPSATNASGIHVWISDIPGAVPSLTAPIRLFGLNGLGFNNLGACAGLATWGSVQTKAQLEAACAAMLAGTSPSGAALYYPLTFISGSTFDLTDHSGNAGAALTLSGTPTNTAGPTAPINPNTISPANSNIYCQGNSLVQGAPFGSGTPWPAQMDALLASPYTVTNNGVAGTNYQQVKSSVYTVLPLYDPAKLNIITVLEFTNSSAQGRSSADMIADCLEIVDFNKSRGFYTIFTTGIKHDNPNQNETERAAVNASLLGGSSRADYVVDLGSLANLQNTADTTYFTDATHLTGLANADLATAIGPNGIIAWLASLGPIIGTQPSDASVVIGGTATFTVGATGIGTVTYQWQLNGVNVSGGSGGTSASYTTPALNIGDNGGSYTCIVTDSNGSATSNAAALVTFYNVTGSLSDGALGDLAIGEFAVPAGSGTVASGYAASLAFAMAGAPPSALQLAAMYAAGIAAAACAGAGIVATYQACLGGAFAGANSAAVNTGSPTTSGIGLPAGTAVAIAAGRPASLDHALCGAVPACVAPSSPAAIGLGLGAGLGAGIVTGIPTAHGLTLVGANGAAVNGSFVTGTPTGLGLSLSSGSGYGIAIGSPSSLGQSVASGSAVLFAPGRPASLGLALPAETGATIAPASPSTQGYAWVSATGAGINSSATPGYPAGYGLGLASGSGYGIAAGTPAALGQSAAVGSAVAFTSSRPASFSSSAAAASSAAIESGTPKTIGLSFALAGAVVIVPGFAIGTGTALGYSLVSVHGVIVAQVLLSAPPLYCSPLIDRTAESFSTPIIDRS